MIWTWVGVVTAYTLVGVLVLLTWCRMADDDTADSEALWLAVCLWPVMLIIFTLEGMPLRALVRWNTDRHNRRIGR